MEDCAISLQRPIKVLHVLYVMNTGGIETWLTQVLKYIDRNRYQMDFLVHVLHPSACSEQIQKMGSQIILCPHPRTFLWQPWRYIKAFKECLSDYGPYDIVHSHASHFSGFSLYLARQAGISKRIAHSHDDTTARDAHASWLRRIYIWLGKWLIQQNATLGLAASKQAAACLFGQHWYLDSRWQVLHCGIDLQAFRSSPDPEAIRADLGIAKDALVIGFVGRLVEQKNPLFVLDIVAEIIKQVSHVHLIMMGQGHLQHAIKDRIQQLKLEHAVTLAGFCSNVADVMLGAMDVLLLPSLHEGLGLVLVEAQAAGLPCVCSNIIPQEANVVDELVQRISLECSAAEWAMVVLSSQEKQILSQMDALLVVEASPFNLQRCVKSLEKTYEFNDASTKTIVCSET